MTSTRSESPDTSALPWRVWQRTLTTLQRTNSARATHFRHITSHVKRLDLQPAADLFWEGTGSDFAEWREFPPLTLPWPVLWAEWQSPEGYRVGTVYREHARMQERLTGSPSWLGVLLTQLSPDAVGVECFAPCRTNGPWVANFLYFLAAGRVVEHRLPGGGYLAPRVLPPGLARQAAVSGIDPTRMLSAIEVVWVKPVFFALGQPQPGPVATVSAAELH